MPERLWGDDLKSVLAVVLLSMLATTPGARGATLADTRTKAIAWLEAHQNADGSWGEDPIRQVVTAEAWR